MRIRPKAAGGFSMIELLVAVLVMGIGVLGITGLQVLSLQNNRLALQRGAAVYLAYDMADRIRANTSASYDGLDIGDGPPAVAVDCMAGTCAPDDMATFDQAAWKCVLGSYRADATCQNLEASGAIPPATAEPGLPSGDGAVEVNGAVVTITVQWQEANNATPSSISIDTQI